MEYLKYALILLGLLAIVGIVLCIRKCKKGGSPMGCCKGK